jgi:hypothetical protein
MALSDVFGLDFALNPTGATPGGRGGGIERESGSFSASYGAPAWPLRRPKAAKSERSIMAQTGHRSAQMVRRYIREGELFSENAAAGLL